jgi:hypothetical protein
MGSGPALDGVVFKRLRSGGEVSRAAPARQRGQFAPDLRAKPRGSPMAQRLTDCGGARPPPVRGEDRYHQNSSRVSAACCILIRIKEAEHELQ